jgi:Rad3-related DNA helicase
LRANVTKIVDHHVSKGERGIILMPSFKLQEEIVDELQQHHSFKNYQMFEQRRGEKLADILGAFKAYTGGPAVLITPSGYEGVDLPGDLSRFQIMTKAPFPSLGDARFKVICDRHPDIYSFATLSKIIQGAGRSVRSATDHAVTYILDSNAQRLWNSNHNVWQDEFSVRFTRFL